LKINQRYILYIPAIANTVLSSCKTLARHREVQPKSFVEADTADDDIAHVLYPSGTESRHKGVMLYNKSLISEYVCSIVVGKMDAGYVAIRALPLYHSAQLHVFLGPSIYLGSSGIILGAASPELILKTIEEEKATLLFCPPTVWIGLLRHPDF